MKAILREKHNCRGIYEVRRTGLLVDGRDYYRAFYHAAKRARRYILVAGWQFDSGVALLRGEDLKEAEGDARLRAFLNGLCQSNPQLEIYLLAWDYALLYMLDREWFQDVLFNWMTSERLHFRFDDRHAVGASHHQKFVVIDGAIGFVGGLDICASRWDDRSHRPVNPLRVDSNNRPYNPYHDMQSYHTGPVVAELTELFKQRWSHSGGGEIVLPPPVESEDFEIESALPIAAERVALSRTRAKTLAPMQDSVREIRSLYLDAVQAAERLIYIENQYFSSQAIYQALMDRMRTQDRPPLQIIIILPRKLKALAEEISMGVAQAKMLRSLNEMASKAGHSLGVFYSGSTAESGEIAPTYTHSKLLLVDDRFLTMGSANLNNRSMGLDTELNVVWEADSEDQAELIDSIRSARVNLLQEHTGAGEAERRDLTEVDGLVDYLNRLADQGGYRLHHHTMETLFGDMKIFKEMQLEEITIDPEKPTLEENIYELISHDKTGLFSRGITILSQWLERRSRETALPPDARRGSGLSVKGYVAYLFSILVSWFRDVKWFRYLVYLLLFFSVLWLIFAD